MTTKIPFVDEAWNLTAGCSVVNVGCKNCWARGVAARLAAKGIAGYEGVTKDGKWTGQINLLDDNLTKPLHWKKPKRIFVCSMSDIFHEKLDGNIFKWALGVMGEANQHAYLVFTKRYEHAANSLTGRLPKSNVWIIFSISNQEIADLARPYLERIASWGWNTGVSYEPALGVVEWAGYEFIKWVVVGAESGKDRRPFDVHWADIAYRWCKWNEILFYMKQSSAYRPGQQGRIPDWLWNIKEVMPYGKP